MRQCYRCVLIALIIVLKGPSANAEVIQNLPVKVVSTSDTTELTGTVHAFRPTSGYQPIFREVDKVQPTPAVDATFWGKIPRGNAIKSVDYYVKPTGTSDWQQCTEQKYTDPKYGFPTTRRFCGKYKNVELQLGNGNFSCNNIASDDHFLDVAFTLTHISKDYGFDFRIVIHHLSCSKPAGSFRSN